MPRLQTADEEALSIYGNFTKVVRHGEVALKIDVDLILDSRLSLACGLALKLACEPSCLESVGLIVAIQICDSS